MSTFENTVVDLLQHGISIRFRASGDSMHPSLHCGDHLHVAPVAPAALLIGDVVLAKARRGLTAHRIVRLTGEVITTRGDNALQSDAPLPPEAILGRVTTVERRGALLLLPPAPARIAVAARRSGRFALNGFRTLWRRLAAAI